MALRTRREGGGGSERRCARISQVISNVAAATFLSVSGRIVSSPNPESSGEAKELS